ncbi:Crp/Fnr family transcriptional regulator [Spirosoma sp. KCTC 42546]|uniref:Crp/Fnr family transcriptional regulator n=1 Tax=Spirosoma sp. KCTC 42546 TaxID=2520506 RepID=UPI0011598D91|nr:Crp/Fnr family transcriptional regulator [Spirosoma sp. KCTC 42546]QDK82358.1 Crp/Fnr family transcriptional regulator [Spirosoma sp. KCTC 42546]
MYKALQEAVNAIMPMTDADFVLLDAMTSTFSVLKGQTLMEPGRVCTDIYFLTHGVFRMYYVDPDGREINYRFALENNFMVDFQSFLSRKPSHYYWQAMENARGFAFSYNDVQEAYRQSRNWERFGRLMAEQVYQQVNERIELLQFLTPEQRYLHVVATQPALVNQISQFHLSSYLGVTPESLSRIRKRLSQH